MCLESTIFYYFPAWCVVVVVVAMATHRHTEADTYWSFTLPPSQWKVLFNHWTMKLDSKPSEVANSVKGSQSFLLNSAQRIAESASSIFWFPWNYSSKAIANHHSLIHWFSFSLCLCTPSWFEVGMDPVTLHSMLRSLEFGPVPREDEGFEWMHNKKCLTVFSAPQYCLSEMFWLYLIVELWALKLQGWDIPIRSMYGSCMAYLPIKIIIKINQLYLSILNTPYIVHTWILWESWCIMIYFQPFSAAFHGETWNSPSTYLRRNCRNEASQVWMVC